ncbi:MAG: hypothetical protein CM15mP49_12130 [Actinomycetota bacterium]|nr:MAG: hypothetical protein CM15mP49_12130 [Actinomycetota bacterium]
MSLINSAERSAGYAMFSDQRLALAVARGSGPAVAQLGSVANKQVFQLAYMGQVAPGWLVAVTVTLKDSKQLSIIR